MNRWLLPLEVLVARGHAMRLVAVALCLAALAALLWQASATARTTAELRAELREHHATQGQPRASTNADRGAAFERLLGRGEDLETHLGQVFAAAKRHGVGLTVGDYRLATDNAGGFRRYHMVLPVKGSFSAIQAFSQQVLLDLPFAALEEISLKRASIDATQVDAKTRFVLFLRLPGGDKTPTIPAPSASAVERP